MALVGMKVIGTGRYVPDHIVTNEDFTKIVETSDEWITKRTGIKQRHISNGEPTWQMGLKAAKNAVENAGIDVTEIDMIVHTSVTADYFYPSMSCIIQGKLGAVHAFGIDISCACAGFVYAMDMAQKYIALGDAKNVLVISSENITKTVDYTDRSTCVLFGDGAGAVVVTAGENRLYSHLGAEGEGAEKIYAHSIPPTNAFTDPENAERLASKFPKGNGFYMYMDGREVYKFATRVIPTAVTAACEKAGITPQDLAMIVPHQANSRIIDTAAQKLGVPVEKFYINIENYGNTSSASIPMCLDELCRDNKLKRGDKVAIVGFGAGLTYGASVFEF